MERVRKAVIPIAGLGTRFLPATKAVPKEMLPIIDKPTLQYIVEEAIDSGIEEILLITNPYKKTVEDHFDRSYELESRLEKSNKLALLSLVRNIASKVKIYYIRQGEPLGTGHAIKLARTFVGNEPFAIMYGDDLMYYKDSKPVIRQLIDVYERYQCNVIGVQEVDKNIVNKYGIIDFDNQDTGKIRGLVEKPKIEDAPSNMASLGRYVVKSEIFDILDEIKMDNDGEYKWTDALRILIEQGNVYACQFEGKYYDIGNKIGYLKANIDFALDRDDLKEELSKYLDEITNN